MSLAAAKHQTTPPASALRVDAAAAPTLWGADPFLVHDRLWIARGVQVVRPGGGPPDKGGPRLYLLLRSDELVDFPVTAPARRLVWANARAIRLRVREIRRDPYREVVRRSPEGGFRAVTRLYSDPSRTAVRCWLTADQRLADAWRAAPDAATARRAVRSMVKRRQSVPLRQRGRVIRSTDATEIANWLCAAARTSSTIPTMFPGVYSFQPGVWVHETSTVPPDVRFAGPCLVGAGCALEPGSVVVGPIILADAAPTPLQPVEWDLLRSPFWNLLPPGPRARRLRNVTKRAFDVAFSACVLGAAAPIFPIIMFLLWRQDGFPLFFAHRRQTIKGREFPCYKFRTMYRDAEGMKAQLQAQNVCDGPQFFVKDDPRVHPVGRFLRKSHLDELPQFWNVLLGHMSVVGPRPSPNNENQFCPAWREARLSVRPGVTGLWQVKRSRRPETDFQEWIRYDLEYTVHQSWRLDIWIIAQTVLSMIRRSESNP